MCGFRLGFVGIFAILGMFLAVPAGAQENLDSNKTAAQLFTSDCAICHKSAQGLAKSGGILGLENFLRQHYTASRESAAAIAAYLQSVGRGPAAPAPGRAVKRTPKGDDKAKAAEKKPAAAKPGDAKIEPKASDAKPSAPKASEPKPSGPKASEPKASEPKPKPSEPKPSESKPAEGGKSD
jgi:hypothetical protein